MIAVSETICIRNTSEDDLELVLQLESHELNRPFIIPWMKSQHLSALSNNDMLHVCIESVASAGVVGFGIMAGLSSEHRSVEFMRMVIGPKRRGFGREALRLLKRFVFDGLKQHRLWLDVKEQNSAARALYEKEGFVVEGTLRDCLYDGNGFESLVVMSMLDDEYKRISKA